MVSPRWASELPRPWFRRPVTVPAAQRGLGAREPAARCPVQHLPLPGGRRGRTQPALCWDHPDLLLQLRRGQILCVLQERLFSFAFFSFYYVLCNERLTFCDFIFYGKIVLQIIRYAVQTLEKRCLR